MVDLVNVEFWRLVVVFLKVNHLEMFAVFLKRWAYGFYSQHQTTTNTFLKENMSANLACI